MKKILLIGAVALCGALNAQMTKGSWVVGGSTNLNFSNTTNKIKFDGTSVDGPKLSTFTFTPSAGYFVMDKLAVGMDLSFISATQNDKESDIKSTTSTVSVMPTGTYYFKSASNIVPYLGAGVGYASITEKYTSGSVDEKDTSDGLAWKAKGGVVYLITPSIGVDLGLGYNAFSTKQEIMGYKITQNINTFGVNAGFSIFF